MLLLQLAQRLHRRFLQHLLQHGGGLSVTDEDAVILGRRGGQPQPVAHHVGLRHGLQRLGGADIDVAADHHRMDIAGGHSHQPLVERQLQVEQRLTEPLPPLPAEHRDRHQYLARYSIRWQSATLSAGMNEDALFLAKPLGKFTLNSSLFTFKGLLQQPRRATATA